MIFTADRIFRFYKLYDIYAGTLALIVATAVVLIYSWVRYRKVEKMALITFLMVAVFGGLTLFFHNDEFIKWKVTVIYGLFGRAAHQPVGDEEAADPAHAGERTDPAAGCVERLNIARRYFYSVWSGEYLYRILAAAEYLGQLRILTALTLIFTLLSGVYIYRHMPQDDKH